MYVNAVGRYLGDANAGAVPSAARLAELSQSCAKSWKAYKKSKGKNFPHVWRAFLAANPICREGIAIRWGYQPALSPCGDANTGLLIDCWDAALQKGVNLNGMGALGISLTQGQLTRASRYYASLPHAQQKRLRNPTGYIFNGTRMVRNRNVGLGRLGQDDGFDFWDTPTDYLSTTTYTGPPLSSETWDMVSAGVPAAPDIFSTIDAGTTSLISPGGSSPAPLSDAWWNEIVSPSPTGAASPTSSIVSSVAALLKSATGGGGQQQQGQASAQPGARPPLQNSTLIPGVPNVILYAGGAFLLLIAMMGGRRR